MGYKVLYTNGDSWTYGDEITHPTNKVNDDTIRYYNTWPWILSQELNIGVCINESLPGRSNYRIFRRTLDFIFKWIERGKDPKDLMIVIGWTTSERYEIPVENRVGKSTYANLLVNIPLYEKEKYSPEVVKKINQFNNLYYELVDVNKLNEMMILQMKTLRDICKHHEIGYFDFFTLLPDPLKFKLEYGNIFKNLFDKSFMNTVTEKNWSLHTNKHPTIETQTKWALELKSFINEYNL